MKYKRQNHSIAIELPIELSIDEPDLYMYMYTYIYGKCPAVAKCSEKCRVAVCQVQQSRKNNMQNQPSKRCERRIDILKNRGCRLTCFRHSQHFPRGISSYDSKMTYDNKSFPVTAQHFRRKRRQFIKQNNAPLQRN